MKWNYNKYLQKKLKGGDGVFSNLVIVKSVISETEIEVLEIGSAESIIIKASKEYVQSIKVGLKDSKEIMMIEYDSDSKTVNENIELE